MSGPLAQADKPIEPLLESIWDQGSDMLEPSRFSGVAKKIVGMQGNNYGGISTRQMQPVREI